MSARATSSSAMVPTRRRRRFAPTSWPPWVRPLVEGSETPTVTSGLRDGCQSLPAARTPRELTGEESIVPLMTAAATIGYSAAERSTGEEKTWKSFWVGSSATSAAETDPKLEEAGGDSTASQPLSPAPADRPAT